MRLGTILLHKDFAFVDGTTAHKYLIILGAESGIAIVVKTTSKGSRYRNDHGCQAGNRFPAYLLTVGCCCLPKSTWVCIDEFYEMAEADLQAKLVQGQVYKHGELPLELIRDLQVCVASCDDISANQERVVRACFVQVT
jgi:ribosomal protein S26